RYSLPRYSNPIDFAEGRGCSGSANNSGSAGEGTMSAERRRQGWVILAIAAGLGGAPGCLSSQSALAPLPPKCVEACETVPCACRGKVYVFLLNGFDPLGLEAAQVRTALVRAGFPRVYDGQFYHTVWFGDEMRRIHAEEPDARFAVVGIGAGVEFAA